MRTATAAPPPPPRRAPRFTPEARLWYSRLSDRDRAKVAAALDQLAERGAALGRPHVDHIKGSRHHNMKELRSVGGHLRALFAFDPHRQPVVLVGGDKTNDWEGWYRRTIPVADKLYDQHLRDIGKGGQWRDPAAGRPSEPRDR